MSGRTPGQAAHARWHAARWPNMPQEQIDHEWAITEAEAKTAWEAAGRPVADRERYAEALQRIVDAVAAGDAAAVDKLARNALGLTRVGRPRPFQPAPELASVRAVLDAFDWETGDRQYALEHIDDILNGRPR